MKRKHRPLHVLATHALLGFAAHVAHAQTYDPTADYSAVNNPNGVWSAGYTATANLGSTFISFDVNNGVTNGLNSWYSTTIGGDPNFCKNLGMTRVFGTDPGQIKLHPGPDNQYGILRFTAPSSGVYTLSTQFFSGDSGSTADSGDTDATIFLNSDSASPLYFAPTTNTDPSYSTSLNLLSGDVLSFAVGSKGSYFYDSTPLTVRLVATPEPSTWATLAVGVLWIGTLTLRGRRRPTKDI